MERRRIVGGMLVLTVLGFVLLVPPLVHLFNHDATLFGMPQIVAYLFVVWFILIVGTALLTRVLPPEANSRMDEGEG